MGMKHRDTEGTEGRDEGLWSVIAASSFLVHSFSLLIFFTVPSVSPSQGIVMNDQRDPLTADVIAAAIEVHRELGPGLLESVYQKCLNWELRSQGMECSSQHRLPLAYKGATIDEEFVLDFYFPGRLIVELKAVEKLLPIHEAQLMTYLRLSRTRVGLLINFNVPLLKDGLKRMVV
jgi:GxxExxY protein